MSFPGSGQNLVDIAIHASNMKRSLSSSLYLYVEKSLEDMLEEYMLLVNNENVNIQDDIMAIDINSIIARMLELPLEFDSTSCQLAASLVLGYVERNIKSTKACIYLLKTMLRKKSAITVILKSDFLTLLEQILTREVKEGDFQREPGTSVEQSSNKTERHSKFENETEDEDQLNPIVEGRAYADVLIELYRDEFVNATQVLVCLQELSKYNFSFYRTYLLLYLLYKIGSSVENKLSKRNCRTIHDFSLPTTCLNFSGSSGTGTFDSIYKRLGALITCTNSTELLNMYDKIMKQKQRKTSKVKPKKTRSKDGLKNVCLYRGHKYNQQNNLSSSDTTLALAVNKDKERSNEEGITTF